MTQLKKTIILFFISIHLFGGTTQISTSGVNASDPQVGIDKNGNAVAVWVENESIISSNCPQSGIWNTSSTISSTGSSSPRLVVDLNGNATAIWIENGILKAASQPFGGTWSSATVLSTSGAATPEISVDATGNVVAIWNLNGSIESATLLLNGTWSATPDTITTSGGDSPQIAIGANGNVVAVWHEVINLIDTIFYSTKLLMGTWSTPLSISNSTSNSVNPRIAVDTSGNALAIWFAYEVVNSAYSNVVVQVASKIYNESFSTPVDISNPGIYDPLDLLLSVKFDGNGNAMAFWNTSFDGSTFSYQSSIKFNGANWSQVLNLVGQDLHAIGFDLAIDSEGHAVVIYMTYDPVAATLDILCRRMDIFAYNPGWSPYLSLSTGNYNAFPKGVVATNGTSIYAAGVWLNYDGSNENVQAAIGLRPTLPAAPTNLQVTQASNDFYLFTEYYNTFTWTASTDATIKNYIIFRNGQVIAVVPSTTVQYIDENQYQNGQVTYGIAVVDDYFYQSPVVTVSFP